MGVIGNALNAASGDNQFVDGYTPDRCWFRNGYITKDMIGRLRDSIIGSDELSEEDCVLIIDYVRLKEEDTSIQSITSKLDYRLETIINKWQNNRGVQLDHADEEFVMRMLGWRDYCLLCGIISQGGSVSLRIKTVGENNQRHGYYIERLGEEK